MDDNRIKGGHGIYDLKRTCCADSSLSKAAAFALLTGDDALAEFLHDKMVERRLLINQLYMLHVESAGALLPGVPLAPKDEVCEQIESLSRERPGLHPLLQRISDTEKMKYMVCADNGLIN